MKCEHCSDELTMLKDGRRKKVELEHLKEDHCVDDPDGVQKKLFIPIGGGFHSCVGVIKEDKFCCSDCHKKHRDSKKEKKNG